MMSKLNMGVLPHKELHSARTGERHALSAVLTDILGFRALFVHHEIVPPGRRASSAHFHTRREEMAVVLEGEVTAVRGGERVVLGQGDFVGFLPGIENAHYLVNESTGRSAILVIASNPGGNRMITVERVEAAR
jgi:uncharacterized cupin superfamily protein